MSGLYELKWDEAPEYIKDSKAFRGFFAGEGHRTYIPNQFFDVVVPTRSLAVLKVVGSALARGLFGGSKSVVLGVPDPPPDGRRGTVLRKTRRTNVLWGFCRGATAPDPGPFLTTRLKLGLRCD